MKKEQLQQALDQVRDTYIAEAARYKKRRFLPWVSAVAAVLVLTIGLHFLQAPLTIQAEAVALAEEPRVEPQPDLADYPDVNTWREENDLWKEQELLRLITTRSTMEQMTPFVQKSMQIFLKDAGENQIYSPVNAYIGLAMTAELTGGQTRQQLLDALGTEDAESLRSQVSALWENIFVSGNTESVVIKDGKSIVYASDAHEISTLANSLWLDEKLDYNHRSMANLARYYYASVYRQDLSDPQAVADIRTWLDQNTGNFLQDATGQLELPEEALMVLYSTIYFRSHWEDDFQASCNTQGIFHGTAGNTAATFMNKHLYPTHYYFGDDFGAVALDLKNGSRMWFLLPDEGKTVSQILDDSQYLDMITATDSQWGRQKYMLVNLSVPKFDVSATTDLRPGLEEMGITRLFDPAAADFSPSLNTPAYVSSANQSIRISVNEQGVTAASYTQLQTPGDPQPPKEIINFILDRPFLFVITKGQIPLFAGVIHQPQ